MVKILRRTANFRQGGGLDSPSDEESLRMNIPKKTKVFVDQTMRERDNSVGTKICRNPIFFFKSETKKWTVFRSVSLRPQRCIRSSSKICTDCGWPPRGRTSPRRSRPPRRSRRTSTSLSNSRLRWKCENRPKLFSNRSLVSRFPRIHRSSASARRSSCARSWPTRPASGPSRTSSSRSSTTTSSTNCTTLAFGSENFPLPLNGPLQVFFYLMKKIDKLIIGERTSLGNFFGSTFQFGA